MNGMARVNAGSMVAVVITIFVLAILAGAFTWPLQQQVDAWSANLTDNGQTAAATIVDLIPLLLRAIPSKRAERPPSSFISGRVRSDASKMPSFSGGWP